MCVCVLQVRQGELRPGQETGAPGGGGQAAGEPGRAGRRLLHV